MPSAERSEFSGLKSTDMNKNIFTAILLDASKAFLFIEAFYISFRHQQPPQGGTLFPQKEITAMTLESMAAYLVQQNVFSQPVICFG